MSRILPSARRVTIGEPRNSTGCFHWAALFVVLFLELGAGSLPAADLLSNPGFESDPAGANSNQTNWMQYGGNIYNETDATIAHGGSNYFKVYQQFNGA